jgi:NAD(P)-dependent dehydrogenase (short-subunit alcohol dehydrogenase family)
MPLHTMPVALVTGAGIRVGGAIALALGRAGDGLARAVLFPACDAPDVTGEVLNVDGGRSSAL